MSIGAAIHCAEYRSSSVFKRQKKEFDGITKHGIEGKMGTRYLNEKVALNSQ